MAKRDRVHVVAVRLRFSVPVTKTEARKALCEMLPHRGWPKYVVIDRSDEIVSCEMTGRLATKREAGNG